MNLALSTRPAVAAGAIAWLLGALSGGAVLAEPLLKSRQDFVVGANPRSAVVVDFDLDGHFDFITADQIGNSLSLAKGFGDGTFRVIATVVAGSTPLEATYADANNDGFADLITANFLSQNVTVNLGNGLGGFAAPLGSAVSGTPAGIVTGHWNGDGHLDAATVNTNQNQVSVLLGIGDGRFGAPVLLTVGSSPRDLVTADFNDDGLADLAVSNRTSANVQVWRGNGAGGFLVSNTLSTGAGTGPSALGLGDFNEDGRPDLIVALNTSGQVRIYPANATGGFNTHTTLSPGAGPRAVRAADVNADGNQDLLTALAFFSGTGELSIQHGNGAGGLAAPIRFDTGPTPIAIGTADFNEDGGMDVITANQTGDTVSLLQTAAGGAFIVQDTISLLAAGFPSDAVSGDFNADGKPDIAIALEGDSSVGIGSGNGAGGFAPLVRFGLGSSAGPHALALADFDRDGRPDIVTANTGNGSISYLRNTGAGFTVTNGFTLGPCTGPVDIATGEISGDQFPDVAVICDETFHLCTRLGTGGAGSAAFGAPVCTVVDPTQIDPVPGGVTLGNFNFDALEDAAITSRTFGQALIAFADGLGGILDIPGNFLLDVEPVGIVRGDLNGDGYEDLVAANSGSANLSALLGDGGGAFTFPSILSPAGEGAVQPVLADFNLDGFLDAAVANINANNVSLLLGDGFGGFTKAGDFGTRAQPLGLAAGDFNLDGKPDIVVTDSFSDSLSILINQSPSVDPLQILNVTGTVRTILRWGVVPGGVYDVIRGTVLTAAPGPGFIDLGPVTCIANDLAATDIAATPDTSVPPVGNSYFYMVRATVGGVPGSYGESSEGFPRTVTSGGCPN